MAAIPLPDAQLRAAYNAVKQHESFELAAQALGLVTPTLRHRYKEAVRRLKLPTITTKGRALVTTPGRQLGADAGEDQRLIAAKADATRFRRAYTDVVKDRADEERVIRLFERSIRAMPTIPATHFKSRVPIVAKSRAMAKSPEVPMLVRSDQQIGEHISASETFGINRYDFSVFQDRLESLEDRTLDILSDHQRADMPKIVVPYLGDNISGRIHAELQMFGHQHVIDQVYLGACAEALFLYRLLKFGRWSEIVVPCVSGNHGRLDKEKNSKQYFRNFDYLFVSIMATLLRNVPQIRFHIPQCLFTMLDIADHRVLLSHGHELPPSSLGIPLYSINRASAAYQELLAMSGNARFQYWFLGHFHRPLELDGSFVNGTMAGLSEYGIGKFKPISPLQRLFGFHPKWGRAWEYPIQLDKAPPAKIYRFESAMAPVDALDMFAEQTSKADKAAA